MDISRDQIRQLGALARLELSDGEVEDLLTHLPSIVEYVSHLQSIETTSIAMVERPTTSLRLDQVEPSGAANDILDQAPEKNGQHWKVDAVFS